MKVCLIRCPSPFLIDDMVFPPLGLMAVGTALKVYGMKVTIYDGPLDDIPTDYNVYGIGPTTPEYHFALKSKDIIKSNNPNARIVIGGPFATLNHHQCLEDNFDCVVTGDGEKAALRAFAGEEQLIHGGENTPLDKYPITDRSIIDLSRYKYYLNDRKATTIVTSRGCPNRCGFCCKNYINVRFNSIEKVIEEINQIHFDFGYSALAFPEDIFILKRERTEAICKHLKNLDIIWRCLVRGDLIVKYGNDFVKMMKQSGCVEVGMGIESGSDKILSIANKGESIEDIKQSIKIMKNNGIRTKGFFIVGLPGENLDTINETRNFLDEVNLDDVDIKIFQPYPGTPIWDNKDNYDIYWDDMNSENMFYKGRQGDYHGNIRTSSLTSEQIYNEWVDLENTYKWKTA